MSWWDLAWNALLIAAVINTVLGILLLLTLPSAYSHFNTEHLTEDDFPESAKEDPEKSGYNFFKKYKDSNCHLKIDASVQIVILGDIGRSPRMQYHALSIAAHGGKVDIIGYTGSEVHPDIRQSRLITIIPIPQFPPQLQTNHRLLFLLLAPLKVLWQILSLYYALGYTSKAAKWMLIQNPPSIPTLAVAQLVCFLRNTRLVIDWHNFGYSILALRLGPNHPLVRISEYYERFFSTHGIVHAHFCVTNAMSRVLATKWNIPSASPLHDRPAQIYQPLTPQERSGLLHRLPGTAPYAAEILAGTCRLLLSSTSWTPDEDFSLLLRALEKYSNAVDIAPDSSPLPNIIAIITGRGPQRDHYLRRIQSLTNANRLTHVLITTAWLSPQDYASLLGAADLGVSLHTSSSGVDLPMKVVDMFGTGLPVAGWSAFEAWSELVREGVNGRGFESADGLAEILEELFGGDGEELKRLRRGAMEECKQRWEDEWMPVAGKLFELKP